MDAMMYVYNSDIYNILNFSNFFNSSTFFLGIINTDYEKVRNLIYTPSIKKLNSRFKPRHIQNWFFFFTELGSKWESPLSYWPLVFMVENIFKILQLVSEVS